VSRAIGISSKGANQSGPWLVERVLRNLDDQGVSSMRHPFDGVNVPRQTTRRSWLGGALAALAGLVGLGRAKAAAPPMGRARTGPEPSPEPPPRRKPPTKGLGEEGRASTAALGEEGGRLTTRALNEEGGKMTRALGEAGGGPRPTTLAVGEEGGRK
jgi:hypothetical protein